MIKDLFLGIQNFILSHKIVSAIIAFFIFVSAGGIINGINERNAKIEQEKSSDEILAELKKQQEEGKETSDSMLMKMQDELVQSYGELPKGYIWDMDGTLLSLGDKDMSAEDVVYAYFRALSTLDMSTVQRYSRDSVVVETYEGYYDEKDKSTDYMDSFMRSMYSECLKSIKVNEIEDTTVFANNKQVFSVNVSMIDLTNKDFWYKDKEEIYKNLYMYDSEESDSTRGDMYLYDYILDYYKSDSVKTRDVSVDITVQKYPDLDSGWLVSIDTDVDDACKYSEGKLVVSFIKEEYQDEGYRMMSEVE